MKKTKEEFILSKRQHELANLYKIAYGKIILWRKNGKTRVLNPVEIIIFNY